MKTTRELLDLIELRRINETKFEGESISIGSPHVFGGQVLAQAMNAAYRTIPTPRFCHSLHAYFILPGDLRKKIRFRVQLIRDGGSFTTRYIIAEQDRRTIFVMAASFQREEDGYNFQGNIPNVPQPESLLSWEEIYQQTKNFLPRRIGRYLSMERPITFKPTVIPNPLERTNLPPYQNVWFKFNDATPDLDVAHFHEMIAYASDYNILMTALQPHAASAYMGNVMMASIDHAMWIHRMPENVTDWFLYNIEVMSTSNARGLGTGRIFDRSGRLIATVSQEGLMRKLPGSISPNSK